MADAPAQGKWFTHSFCLFNVSVLLLGCQAAAGRRAKSQKDAVSRSAGTHALRQTAAIRHQPIDSTELDTGEIAASILSTSAMQASRSTEAIAGYSSKHAGLTSGCRAEPLSIDSAIVTEQQSLYSMTDLRIVREIDPSHKLGRYSELTQSRSSVLLVSLC